MTAPRNDPRRRFFPARLAQQLPARTVELAVQLRKEGGSAQPPPPPPPPQPPPQPPYWEGRDVDGAHTTVLHIKRKAQFIPSEGVVFTYFQEGLWVAVVDGATEVDWAITITPGYAHGAPNEKYGDEVELELSSAARQGPQPLSVLYLDAVDPDDELSEWERRWEMLHHYPLDLPMDKFSVPRICLTV